MLPFLGFGLSIQLVTLGVNDAAVGLSIPVGLEGMSWSNDPMLSFLGFSPY